MSHRRLSDLWLPMTAFAAALPLAARAQVPAGGELTVNTYTTYNQAYPAIAFAPNGDFVVVWSSYLQDGSGTGIVARRFDPSGNGLGAEFVVNVYTTGYQFYPWVGNDALGNFVVNWWRSDADGAGTFGRRFTAAGAARSTEFQVNTYTTGGQRNSNHTPSVSADDVGNFTVVWDSSAGQDGSGSSVQAQRFGGLRPAALAVDTAGNGVLEAGETVDVKPSWRNVNGAAQTFGGGLSNITGPPGAAYDITDGSGDYGTVADGSSAPCRDCYEVSVSSPATRPALHWDASAVEAITPDAHGQQKRWLLHVGESFADVPATDPFYRFIETLLHHSITAGCGPTEYCPGDSTTRAQMAAFVLGAREGAGFSPAACSPPNTFADVPETSPSCPFVEELARRGVVAGCGGGNYCPNDPVTREQMGVFISPSFGLSLYGP